MGETSVPMSCLVAVGDATVSFDTKLLHVFPKDAPASPSALGPWDQEFEAGCSDLSDMGLDSPKEKGFWVWSGYIYYPGPDFEGNYDGDVIWRGTWRKATEEELQLFLSGTMP